VIDLTVKMSSSSGGSNIKKETFANVEWLGADMMDLMSPHVRMQAGRLSTGEAAAAVAEKVFRGLLDKAREQQVVVEDDITSPSSNLSTITTTLDLFPDIAIVAGSMELMIPVDKSEKELYDLMFND